MLRDEIAILLFVLHCIQMNKMAIEKLLNELNQ